MFLMQVGLMFGFLIVFAVSGFANQPITTR